MDISRDRAKALLGEGDFEGAIAVLQELTKQEPTDALAWQMLGAAFGSAGKSSESIGAFHHAVELQPSSARAQFNLALALLKADRASEARGHLERALALDPGYEAARTRLADLGGPTTAVATPPVEPVTPVVAAPAPPPVASVETPVAPPPASAPIAPPPPPPAASAPPPISLSPVGGLAAIGGGAAPSSDAPASSGAAPGGLSSVGGATGGAGASAPPPSPYSAPPSFNRVPTAAPDVEASKALTYGIVGFFCFGVILGPMAISLASKGLAILDEYPNADQSQRGTLTTAKVLGIVVTVLWVLGVLSNIILAIIGANR